MNHPPLTDVQAANLRTLIAVRLGLERDAVDTCRIFALSPRAAERLKGLQVEQLWSLVQAIGQTSLFVPRDDLVALIDAPPSVAGALAAAHTPRALSAQDHA